MTFNRFAGIVTVGIASLLVACDDPKTIEGTIWVAGASGSPSKLAGVPVTLLPPKIRDALKAHLNAFDQRVNAATESHIKAATNEALASTKLEKTSVQATIAEIMPLLDEAKERVEDARLVEQREQDAINLASAPINESLRVLDDTKKALETRIAEQRALLANEQARNDATYTEKKALLERQQAEAITKVDRERKLFDDLKAAVPGKRRTLGEVLNKRYVEEKIKISTRFSPPCRFCMPTLCISVQNVGDKAVVRLDARLIVNGEDRTYLRSDLLGLGGESNWKRLEALSVQNKYNEDVYGLPPGEKWADIKGGLGKTDCLGTKIFLPSAPEGDEKRAWDFVGGFNDRIKIEIHAAQAVLADPKKLSSEQEHFRRVWRYEKESPEIVFASEIEANLDPTAKAQLVERPRAVEFAEAALAQVKSQLDDLKPEIATTPALVDAEVQRQITSEEIKKANAKLAELSAPILAAKESRQSADSELAALDIKRTTLEGRLQQLDADGVSLEQKKGPRYDDVQAKAKASLDLSAVETKWYAELLTILKDGGGVTVQSDIDGRYRFEKITWKLPVLFAVSEQRTLPSSTANLRGVYGTQRIPAYFWLEAVDTSKTTLVDLGKSSSVQLTKGSIPAIIERVASVSGLSVRVASPGPKANAERLCTEAHRAGLLNPETLEIFDFREVPKSTIESLASEAKTFGQMRMELAKLECTKEALPATLPDPLILSCAISKVGADTTKAIGIIQAAQRLGDAATLFEFRAKAGGRDGRLFTHSAICVVETSGKATSAMADLK